MIKVETKTAELTFFFVNGSWFIKILGGWGVGGRTAFVDGKVWVLVKGRMAGVIYIFLCGTGKILSFFLIFFGSVVSHSSNNDSSFIKIRYNGFFRCLEHLYSKQLRSTQQSVS